MIIFNKIKISQAARYIIIDAEMDNSDYYKDMYIDSVIIDNQDTYTANGPSSNPIYTYQTQGERSIHLELTKVDLNISTLEKNMFFIYVIAEGTPAPDTPCGLDVNIVSKVLVNTYPIYRDIMKYIKELGDTCRTPYNLIDKLLQLKMLDICVQVGNNIEAIRIWKTYFMNIIDNNINTNCNCNG